jgi:hypothetical protein
VTSIEQEEVGVAVRWGPGGLDMASKDLAGLVLEEFGELVRREAAVKAADAHQA